MLQKLVRKYNSKITLLATALMYLIYLTFTGPCIIKYSNIYPTRCNVTQLFYLKTALHVLSGTMTHHQERKQLYLQHLALVTPLLLSAAIVKEVELV